MKLSNMFHNKWEVPDKVGSMKGQLNRGVWSLSQQGGGCWVSIMTLPTCTFLKLTRERGRPIGPHVHMAWRKLISKADWWWSGSSLIVVVELWEQARPERTRRCEEELMKTFGNWSSTVVWLCVCANMLIRCLCVCVRVCNYWSLVYCQLVHLLPDSFKACRSKGVATSSLWNQIHLVSSSAVYYLCTSTTHHEETRKIQTYRHWSCSSAIAVNCWI